MRSAPPCARVIKSPRPLTDRGITAHGRKEERMEECCHYLRVANDRPAAGPDGKGWNRLRIDVGEPAPRCRLRPTTWQAAWTVSCRPYHCHDVWSVFEMCTPRRCPLQVARDPIGPPAVVRVDHERGGVWVLNRKDEGWGEYGMRFPSWSAAFSHYDLSIASPKKDAYGVYYPLQ